MTDRPIIFSAVMVRALLDGRKTQTRRLAWRDDPDPQAEPWPTPWLRVELGDRLWARETWSASDPWAYRADCDPRQNTEGWGWRPSIHMPRAASRLTLIVTAVKIERLQDISTEDTIAEGAWSRNMWQERDACFDLTVAEAREVFADVWRKLHGAASWDANPEVVAISFAVHQTNIDAMRKAA